MYLYKVGTQASVLINQVSLFQGCPLREVPLYKPKIQVWETITNVVHPPSFPELGNGLGVDLHSLQGSLDIYF